MSVTSPTDPTSDFRRRTASLESTTWLSSPDLESDSDHVADGAQTAMSASCSQPLMAGADADADEEPDKKAEPAFADLTAYLRELSLRGIETTLRTIAAINARASSLVTTWKLSQEPDTKQHHELHDITSLSCGWIPIHGYLRGHRQGNYAGVHFRWPHMDEAFQVINEITQGGELARRTLATPLEQYRGICGDGTICRDATTTDPNASEEDRLYRKDKHPKNPNFDRSTLKHHRWQHNTCLWQPEPGRRCDLGLGTNAQDQDGIPAPYCAIHLIRIRQQKVIADLHLAATGDKIEELNAFVNGIGSGHLYDLEVDVEHPARGPCAICCEDVYADTIESRIASVQCGHRYHKTCLDRLFISQKSGKVLENRCPLCRGEV